MHFEQDDNTASSDSECPDTEGVKSLFLHNRAAISPAGSCSELCPMNYGSQDNYSEYYGDAWSYYSHDIEADERLAMEEPPFGPISEEAEDEDLEDMRRSASYTTSMTTATNNTTKTNVTGDSMADKSPSENGAATNPTQEPRMFTNPSVCRHLSLEHIDIKHREINFEEKRHYLSYPVIFGYESNDSSSSPSPQEAFEVVQSISVNSALQEIECVLHAEEHAPLKEKYSLMRARVTNVAHLPLAHVMELPEVHAGLDLQAYARANWASQSNADAEPRIITISEDDEDEQSSYSEYLAMRRCKNFVNINQLSGIGDGTGGFLGGDSPELLYQVTEEEFAQNLEDDKDKVHTLHRWGRDSEQQASNDQVELSTFAKDQVLAKQEDNMWASLFAHSTSVAESAKGFTAQLLEMSFLDELATAECEQVVFTDTNTGENAQYSPVLQFNDEGDFQNPVLANQDMSTASTNTKVEYLCRRMLPALPQRPCGPQEEVLGTAKTRETNSCDLEENDFRNSTTEEQPRATESPALKTGKINPEVGAIDRQAVSTPEHHASTSSTDTRTCTPRADVVDYRSGSPSACPESCPPLLLQILQPLDTLHLGSRHFSNSQPSRPPPPPPPASRTQHRSKDTTPPTYYSSLGAGAQQEESNFLSLPNSQTQLATAQADEEPLSLFTDPVRSQSIDQLSLLLDSQEDKKGTEEGGFGSCLWSALCRSKSKQFDRAIRTLTDSSVGSSAWDSSDLFSAFFPEDEEEVKQSQADRRLVVSQTRQLRLTHIYDATIEEEECALLHESQSKHNYSVTTHHLLSSISTENPLLVNMISALRTKRSQSYIAPTEFSDSYVRQHRAYARTQDGTANNSSNLGQNRSYTLSSVPKAIRRSARYSDGDSRFPYMWSPPPETPISTSLSPKQARRNPPRVEFLRGKVGPSIQMRTAGTSGSYQRMHRYSGGMLDDYGSGDSGGSASSYRKRLLDQRHPRTSASGRLGDEAPMTPSVYDYNASSRSSTLPYKRRGSWHVDRQVNYPSLDWNSPRKVWDRARWRSFSPERLDIDTSYEGGPQEVASDSRRFRSQSLHRKHLKELTKSTEQLSTGFLDNYRGLETSFDTLRAKLDATMSESRLADKVHASNFRRQISADRLHGRDVTTEELRRQCEREHRRLLKSLMSDSWETSVDKAHVAPSVDASLAPRRLTPANTVLPVQEATLLTAPRTTNPLANPNFSKILRSPAMLQLLGNQAAIDQFNDQGNLADQVTLAAVAGAAAATAMANFANVTDKSACPVPAQMPAAPHAIDEYDWNDPDTLIAAYSALADASGGEKAFLDQLPPELAATLVHYREQLSQKMSASTSGAPPASTSVSTTSGLPQNSAVSSGQQQSNVVLEDVSRKAVMEKENTVVSYERKKNVAPGSSELSSRALGANKNFESSQQPKPDQRTYDFPTKRILLMRSLKGRQPGGNGFGLKLATGRQRPDGRLGSFVEQLYSGDTLSYLHGEISEGDEVVEWHGTPLIGKDAEEVQKIISAPNDEVELLVRSNPSESMRRLPTDHPQHTCSHRSPCVADAQRYMPKLCPSHTPTPHLHEPLHGGGSCFHQSGGVQQHTCQPGLQRPLGPPPPHTCDYHHPPPGPPACIHKQQQQYLGRSGDWTETTGSVRRSAYQVASNSASLDDHLPPPNSPLSERNVSSEATSEVERRPVVPAVNVDDFEENYQRGDLGDSVSHNSSGVQHNQPNDVHDDEEDEDFGEIELILTFDDFDQSLTVHVARARGLRPMDLNGLADPFVKLRLHPDPTEDIDLNRQIKYIPNTLEPEWQQTVVFMNCLKRTLKKRVLEITVWDFDRLKMNDFMGQAIIHTGIKEHLDGQPRWYKLHRLQEIVIPGYRQPGKRTVAPQITSTDQLKTIKITKDVKTPQNKTSSKGLLS